MLIPRLCCYKSQIYFDNRSNESLKIIFLPNIYVQMCSTRQSTTRVVIAAFS